MEFLGPLRASPLAALLFLACLPLWPFVQRHHARLFFTSLSVVMIVLVAGPALAAGLLVAILLAYFPVEWAANLRRGRRLALFAGWMALHVAVYLCMFLPLPPFFRNEKLLRPDHAHWMFLMISGIGLTFMRLVSHLYDRVSGRTKRLSYADYLCYMVYFPQFRCVPVERGRSFAPRLARARANWRPRDVLGGLARIALGLLALAAVPRLAKALPDVFGVLNPMSPASIYVHPEPLPTWQLVLLLHTIPVAIYGLVSGTASIQLGVSRAFGVRGSENTRYPFLATSPRNFWWRWNITVFAWMRDYAYAPLGGGKRRKYLNIVLVFTYCGVLHAVHWRGAVWGLWSGIGVAAVTWLVDRRQARQRAEALPSAAAAGAGACGADAGGEAASDASTSIAASAQPTATVRGRFVKVASRVLGALLTIEWATIGAAMLVDADYGGARLLREYFVRLGAVLAAPFM